MIQKFKHLLSTRYLVKGLRVKFIQKAMHGKYYETVVDFGAGKAPYRKFIDCKKYIVVDNENRGGFTDLILADGNKIFPIDDNFADLVICTEVLEHIRKPQFFLLEINRILKKQGKLILTAPFIWPLHEEPNDFFRYTIYGLEYLLEEAGFKFIKIESSNGFFNTICQLLIINLKKKNFFSDCIWHKYYR